MSEQTVTIEQVSKTFKGMEKPALDEITCGVAQGIITGLAGPDGAGKTTLMRLIAGLMEPASGTITVERLNPIRDVAKLHAVIGYMPQKFGLYEDLTVIENLNLHADLRGVVGEEKKASFERLLAFTDLARFTTRLAGKLSGGMKQKLGLACALLGKPKLLLLDEPSVGVDPISRRELWRMVKELAGGGMTILWSTSYLDEAERCDSVILLNEGKLLFTGLPKDLTGKVAEKCVLLKNSEGSRRQILARALSEPQVMDGVIQGNSIRLVLREGGAKPDLKKIRAGSHAELVPEKPRFEDAFITLLGGGPGGVSVLAEHLKPIEKDGAVVIEAEALTKKFGDFAATDDVTFQVKRGEIFGLLGPNGAGKSTTIKMLTGLLAPTTGSIRILGGNIIDQKAAPDIKRRIGVVPEGLALFDNLTATEYLTFVGRIYGLSPEVLASRSDELLTIMDLPRGKKKLVVEYSHGMKKKLALAAALIPNPDLLFLDEPFEGVDAMSARLLRDTLRQCCARGATVFLTTHILEIVEKLCTDVGIIAKGRVAFAGSMEEIKKTGSLEDLFISVVGGDAVETQRLSWLES